MHRYLRFRIHCGRWRGKIARARGKAVAVRSYLRLKRSTFVQFHPHTSFNRNRTRKTTVDTLLWKRASSQSPMLDKEPQQRNSEGGDNSLLLGRQHPFYPISVVSPENMYIYAGFYRLSRFYLWIQEKKDKHRHVSMYIYISTKRCEFELKQGGYKS